MLLLQTSHLRVWYVGNTCGSSIESTSVSSKMDINLSICFASAFPGETNLMGHTTRGTLNSIQNLAVKMKVPDFNKGQTFTDQYYHVQKVPTISSIQR